MAIYHCRFKVHSRKGGARAAQASAYRSGSVVRGRTTNAVRAAAYRSGGALADPEGEVHDFTSKKGVVWNGILLPDDAPAWAGRRSSLWNAVERTEKRKDAQLFREAELSIPRELSPRQRQALVRAFVQDQFVAKGMVADIGIHCPKASDGGEQPHAHVMLTLREIGPEGFGKKRRDWNDRGLVRDARVAWERYCNAALEEAGSAARVDHRSLADQGRPHAPEPHRGKGVHVRERSGGYHAKHAAWSQSHFASRAMAAVQAIGRTRSPALPVPPLLPENAAGSTSPPSFEEASRRAARAVFTVRRLGGGRLAQDGVAHAAETARRLRGIAPELPDRAQELWGHDR